MTPGWMITATITTTPGQSMSLTPLDRHAVIRGFDRAAADYDRHAVLEKEVESRLLERLMFVRQPPARIVDLGCGTGRACAAMRAQFDGAQVIGFDWSMGMLKRPAVFGGADTGSGVVCADLQLLPLSDRSVDLLFSNLALQWCSDFGAVFTELRRVIRPGGMLLFTCFGPDTLYELRESWASVDDLPHVNEFTDMHNVGDALVAAGFAEPVMDVEHITLKYADVRSVMMGLKHIGSANAAQARHRALTGKRRMRAVNDAYETYRDGDRYPASFEVVYGIAFGPAEGQPLRSATGEVAAFSVDALRGSLGKNRE